ncbi:MAG: SAM-dependent methyltransferase [Geobacteraceae bacterium GWC2_53_11]|nr:MAG: SAM-dependent methyltransferase [Geobacteraceae bacterium GWC2_53_11]
MSSSSGFKDHFSTQAGDYTRYRPGYPPELFAWLAGLTEKRDTAWDCGCGNGQASIGLTPYYTNVIATDPSQQQIDNARAHERISYRVAPAEESGLEAGSIDLVLVAQALHWFDFERFYAEVRRVTRSGGVLAAVSYGELQVEGAPDAVASGFYHRIIGPYWPPERKYVDDGYVDIPFPFTRITAPPFAMLADWNLEQLLGYLGTWSAVKEYKVHKGSDPRELIIDGLRAAWGDEEQTRRISWPLTLLAGRVRG